MARGMGDYLLEGHGDLKIVNGGFVTGESGPEHVYQICRNSKGGWKANPTLGVGSRKYIDDDAGNLPAAVVEGLRVDGFTVSKVEVLGPGQVRVTGAYK